MISYFLGALSTPKSNTCSIVSPKLYPTTSSRTGSLLQVNDEETEQPCKYILFANGAKCGSTALFMYLERYFRPWIADLKGKEKCFRSPPPNTCTNKRPYIMDGCPKDWSRRMKGFKEEKDRVTVILLVRPQADRIQSLINDKLSSGKIRDVDKFALSQLSKIENNFTHILFQTIDMFKDVQIVHHDELLSVAGVNSIFRRVFPNLSSQTIERPIHPNRFSQRDPRHTQLPMSLSTRWKIEDYFEKDNCNFFKKTKVYIQGDNC